MGNDTFEHDQRPLSIAAFMIGADGGRGKSVAEAAMVVVAEQLEDSSGSGENKMGCTCQKLGTCHYRALLAGPMRTKAQLSLLFFLIGQPSHLAGPMVFCF